MISYRYENYSVEKSKSSFDKFKNNGKLEFDMAGLKKLGSTMYSKGPTGSIEVNSANSVKRLKDNELELKNKYGVGSAGGYGNISQLQHTQSASNMRSKEIQFGHQSANNQSSTMNYSHSVTFNHQM